MNSIVLPKEVEAKKPALDMYVFEDTELWKWQISNNILVLFNKRDGYAGYWCPDPEAYEVWRVTPVFQHMDTANDWQKKIENQGKIKAAIVALMAAHDVS